MRSREFEANHVHRLEVRLWRVIHAMSLIGEGEMLIQERTLVRDIDL